MSMIESGNVCRVLGGPLYVYDDWLIPIMQGVREAIFNPQSVMVQWDEWKNGLDSSVQVKIKPMQSESYF